MSNSQGPRPPLPAHIHGTTDEQRTPRPSTDAAPQWTNPFIPPLNASEEEFPRRQDPPVGPTDARRDSDATLGSPGTGADDDDDNKYTFSSYRHPHEISPPEQAHSFADTAPLRSSQSLLAGSGVPRRPSVSFAASPTVKEYNPPSDAGSGDEEAPHISEEQQRFEERRSQLSNLIGLATHDAQRAYVDKIAADDSDDDDDETLYGLPQRRPSFRRRADSMASVLSNGSDVYDPDDPRVTGVRAKYLEDPEDVEKNALRQMDYKSRRKYLTKARIQFNVSSMLARQEFLITLAKALMTFGAPSHRIESQLVAAARILEVEAEFIHIPGVIIVSFGDQELGCSETQFIRCGGRLSLGALHKLHLTYRSVVHDEISAKKATEQLQALLNEGAAYPTWMRLLFAFSLSALICPLAFGGSLLDMWFAGLGALVLSSLQIFVATKSALYANVFEISVAIFVSFGARGLSSIHTRIFCYTAISSSGIIGILPGYLILSSSLELASKNIVCGSVKMVYALIYTLFLGFGLQIGSDIFLLFDAKERHKLDALAETLTKTTTITGSWASDNSTSSDGIVNNTGIPLIGTWSFSHKVAFSQFDITEEGCYRPNSFPWYLQPFPQWTAFIIVPIFSTLSSLANQQPLRSRQLPVMVAISCCAYGANKVANHFIFNRSDVVSAIGAFTVGLLGNVYSRKMGGTAFTSMVTGVLFLVPSGLSQAGGITANGNGIDIGGAMIAVTIGITVGLFMSQALVYMFGSRKGAAVFSF